MLAELKRKMSKMAAGGKKRAKKRKKPPRPADMPRRVTSAYMFYCVRSFPPQKTAPRPCASPPPPPPLIHHRL